MNSTSFKTLLLTTGIIRGILEAPYTFGYLDYSEATAQGISYALIINKNGDITGPEPGNATIAIQNSGSDYGLKKFMDSPNVGAYPFVTYTYFVLLVNMKTKFSFEVARQTYRFLYWFYTDTVSCWENTQLNLATRGL